MCDGARIDEAQARKTEQDYEASNQHPAAHPLRWPLRVRRERPRDDRAVKFAPPHLFNPRHSQRRDYSTLGVAGVASRTCC
jgi:hypothetical protein